MTQFQALSPSRPGLGVARARRRLPITMSVRILGLMAGLAASGWIPHILSIELVDFTVIDVLYIFVLAGVLASIAIHPRMAPTPPSKLTGPLALFVAYAGVSLGMVFLTEPSFFPTAAVSWVRLAVTSSLFLIVTRLIRTRDQLRWVAGAMMTGAAIAVVSALVQMLAEGGTPLGGRYHGLQSINTLGLVSALLVVAGAGGGVSSNRLPRSIWLVLGGVGLLLTKSVGGIVAAAVGIMLLPLLVKTRSHARRRVGVALGMLLLVGLISTASVKLVRPEVFPDSPRFGVSSAALRVIVAAAGWEIFTQYPLVGVGWQHSASPTVISSPEVALRLRETFRNTNPLFFPDVTPNSVHNAYVQVLAELGLAGLALFLYLLLSTRRVARRVMGTEDEETFRIARTLSLWLVVALVWWNDNPIYGGQTEAYVVVITLGLLASMAKWGRANPAPTLA